jgi:hypothetical protein
MTTQDEIDKAARRLLRARKTRRIMGPGRVLGPANRRAPALREAQRVLDRRHRRRLGWRARLELALQRARVRWRRR